MKPGIAARTRKVCFSRARLLLLLMFWAGWALGVSPVSAQIAIERLSIGGGEVDPNKQPFLLPTQPGDVTEAIADFQRFAGREQWEKAFQSLESISKSSGAALVPGANGTMIPAARLVRQLLSSLPRSGKEAYRLFHEADARTQLEQALGDDEAVRLESIVGRFWITATGALAADRLGDLYFEQGRLSDAATLWQDLLNERDGGALSRPLLLVKTGIALVRSDRAEEARSLLSELQQKHAGSLVRLGGQEVDAAGHLALLLSEQSAAPADGGKGTRNAAFALPESVEPRWQFLLLGAAKGAAGQQRGLRVRNRMYGTEGISDYVSPVAADSNRVYINYLGYDLAVDQQTGKLVWRSGKHHEIEKLAQQNNSFMNMECFGIASCGQTVWSVSCDARQMNNQQTPFLLKGRDAATGGESFDSASVDDLKEWSMIGAPACDSSRLYVAATKKNQRREVFILAIDPVDKKIVWSTSLGSYKVDPSQNYYASRNPVPELLLEGRALYVDTHAGSLLRLDAEQGRIDWGLYYESSMPDTSYRVYGQAAERYCAARPILHEGILYFKGMQSTRLYAVDPAGPSVIWKRPVDMRSVLVGVDDERIYLGGESLLALDRKTRSLLWSVSLPPGSTSWVLPLLTSNRIYQYTARGIYEVDKATGESVRLFRVEDPDGQGGRLILTPRLLLAVSNLSVTAFARPDLNDSKSGGD